MPVHNIWVCLMCDNLPLVNHPSLPVWSESQKEQTYLSVDRCPLAIRCHCCNNYTFDHLSKSLLLRMRTCWYGLQLHPSSSCVFRHVIPTTHLDPEWSYVVIAFKFDKLFTVLWDSSECCQLSCARGFYSHCRDLWLSRQLLPCHSYHITHWTGPRLLCHQGQ